MKRRHAVAPCSNNGGEPKADEPPLADSTPNDKPKESPRLNLLRYLRLPVSRRIVLLLSGSVAACSCVAVFLLPSAPRSISVYGLRSKKYDALDRDVILQFLQSVSNHEDTSDIQGKLNIKSHIQLLDVSSSSLVLAATRDAGLYIEYKASRGLGHRLTRAAATYHLASRLGVGLKQDWGRCPAINPDNTSTIDIWEHLFGDNTTWQANGTLTHTDNNRLSISNEVPGYKPYATRRQRESVLARSLLESSMGFYQILRNRFIVQNHQLLRPFLTDGDGRSYVDRSKYVVIGIHIRAGNGETGEFVEKKRAISNINDWVNRMAPVVLQYISEQLLHRLGAVGRKQPLIFVATDTLEVIDLIRETFAEKGIQVISHPQHNDLKGTGPSYLVKDTNCLKAWELQLIDMVLLSLSDVIIAGRYSSFTQTLPLALLFANRRVNVRRKEYGTEYPYCEVISDGAKMACFRTYQGWMARSRKENPLRISFDATGIIHWDSRFAASVDGHEDALAYPLAVNDCLEQSAEFYFDNRQCLEAHLHCSNDLSDCK